MSRPLKAFITYSHKNKAEKDKLIKRLAVMKRNGELETWYDGKISGGNPWNEEIVNNLAKSDILIYLVSTDSLASNACNDEIIAAIDRRIKVIPVILEICDWKGDQQIAGLLVLPEDGRPISKWDSENEGWQNVVDGLRKTISAMGEKEDTASFSDLFQAGNFFMILKQFDEAIRTYSSSIELNLNYAETYNNRGIAYGEKGEYDRAIKDYNKAIELKPKFVMTYNNRGNVYAARGEHDRAIDDFNKVIKLNPYLAETYSNRGIVYRARGEYDRAIDDFNKAIELNPNLVMAFCNRGNAYQNKGKHNRAIADYNKARALNPNFFKDSP